MSRVGRVESLLVSDLYQAQPGQVPAAVGFGVAANAQKGVGDHFAAEGVVLGQAAQLREKLVAVDVVVPRGRHGPLEGARVGFILARRSHLLDAAELGQGVNPVSLEGLYQLPDRLLAVGPTVSAASCR